jgi:hypothetical protein
MVLELALRRTLGITGVLQPMPLKESRPEIRVGVLQGEAKVKACLNLVVFSLRFFLVNCSSNVIFFATSEGSPLSFSFTTNSFYVKVIFLIFRFKGQGRGWAWLCTNSLRYTIGEIRTQKFLSLPSSLFL